MFVVGLTGGIASGKSLVSSHFEERGIAVVDADVIAHEIVEPGSPGLQEVIDRFGCQFLREDGSLDRAALREHVFGDSSLRKDLESILHPRIRERMFQHAANARTPYVILAVPLLVEGGLDSHVDRVLVVDVSEDVQRMRLANRDGGSPEQIDAILKSQCSRETRLQHADDIIDNNGSREEIVPQVDRLHQQYLELAKARQKT